MLNDVGWLFDALGQYVGDTPLPGSIGVRYGNHSQKPDYGNMNFSHNGMVWRRLNGRRESPACVWRNNIQAATG